MPNTRSKSCEVCENECCTCNTCTFCESDKCICRKICEVCDELIQYETENGSHGSLHGFFCEKCWSCTQCCEEFGCESY